MLHPGGTATGISTIAISALHKQSFTKPTFPSQEPAPDNAAQNLLHALKALTQENVWKAGEHYTTSKLWAQALFFQLPQLWLDGSITL